MRDGEENALFVDKVFRTQEKEILHNPYEHETRKLASIREGNVDKLIECQDELWIGELGKVGDDPLRQEKNLGIVMIVLASRAAIRGGLSPELAFTLADTYILSVEHMEDEAKIRESVRRYEQDFTRRVHEQKGRERSNRYVELAKEYVYQHLHGSLREEDIGGMLGISVSHLSRLFVRHEGLTLRQYILQEKVKQAEGMLRYTTYSLEEIAAYLNFSSQSHFGAVFRKKTGMTPGQYRNKYGQVC